MKFIYCFLLSTLGEAGTIEDIVRGIPDAEVWMAISAGNEDRDHFRQSLTPMIDQGQMSGRASRNYLAWALKTYPPIKLEKNTISELDKIETDLQNLVGVISIRPKEESFSYMISKQSNLDIVSIAKLTKIAGNESDVDASSKDSKPKEYHTIELGTFFWPNAERIILEIASREFTIVHGKEAYDRLRAAAWKEFLPEETKTENIPDR